MSVETHTPETAQIWDLSDLYTGLDDPSIAADSQTLEADIAAFQQTYAEDLARLLSDPGQLARALEAYVAIQARAHDLLTYAELRFHTAHGDAAVNTLKQRLTRQITAATTQLEFFRQGLSHLAPEALEQLLQDPRLQPYRVFLQRTQRFQPFLLSNSEERLLGLTLSERQQRWLELFMKTSSGWSYTVLGETLSEAQAMDLLRRTDPVLRQAGYEAVHSQYRDHGELIAFIYMSLIQSHAQEARLRQFDSVLARQAFEQELKAEQVEHLLDAVDAHVGLYQRYYRSLRDQLGLTQLHSYDVNIPLRSSDWKISWDNGTRLVLKALSPLGPELVDKTREFFSQRWIHAAPGTGKTQGAFCAPTASQHPYVLMNWNDNLYSLTAMAHELGHGLHFYETVAEQNVLHLMPPLFLAETASTLNEFLLAEHLMAQAESPAEKRFFLADILQRFLNGIFRQGQISSFERWAYAEGSERELSAEEMNAYWLELSRGRAGDALVLSELENVAWSRIPHIFMYPFYCYNYTLSNLIVLALVHQYRQDPAAFQPRLQRFLRSGGSLPASELLALLQLDLDRPDFYRDAFAVLEDMIAQLEALSPHADTNLKEALA